MFSRFLFLLILLLSSSGVFAAHQEDPVTTEHSGKITEFERKFPLRFLVNYNFVSLWSSEFHEGALVSNRPVDAGLGFGYKDLYLDLIFALPFTSSKGRSKSLAFETGLDFFPGNWWIKGKYRRYSGFSTDNDTNSVFVDLWERDAYISALWLGTSNGKFTPRAAYFLDRKQSNSAGSIIVGGRIQHSNAIDRDSVLSYYQDYRKVVSSWANAGYTYTWVYRNDMFINVWGIAGIAVSAESESEFFFFLPEVGLKLAYGYIADTWSWNMVMESEYSPTIYNDHWEQKVVCAYKILVVRRF